MAKFHITFDATPETGHAPWCGRESSRIKMMQSLSDYLVGRCEAKNVLILEVKEQESVAPPAKEEKSEVTSGIRRRK